MMMSAMAAPSDASSAADPQHGPHDLASDFVQECLGFHTTREQQSKKRDALSRIRDSLESCGIGGSAVDAAAAASVACGEGVEPKSSQQHQRQQRLRRREWRAFLEGRPLSSAGEEDDGFGAAGNNSRGDLSENFMLRDSFVKCLVESCSHVTTTGDDVDDEFNRSVGERQGENINLDVMESSFICLTRLVRLRCRGMEEGSEHQRMKSDKSSKVPMIAPIFGHEFVTAIAPDVVEALKLSDSRSRDLSGSSGAPHAASQLLIALLRSDRPRNEACLPTIRDAVLHPACNAARAFESSVFGASIGEEAPSIGSVACIARVLSSSITAAVETAVPDTGTMDEEEFSMRRETAALNGLQDMRDVLMSVGLACSRALSRRENGAGDGALDHGIDMILGALQEIYDIAAFAVESQLETLLGDEKAMPILAKLRRARSNQGLVDKIVGSAVPNAASARSNRRTMEDEDYDNDMSEDEKESEVKEATTLAPLYAHMTKPPAFLTTLKALDSLLDSVADRLDTTDASLWDERLDALIDLECILAGGVARMGPEARHLFVERLRKMPLAEQFQDLRSQITQQACRVIVATSYEYRDHVSNDPQLNQALSHLVECLVFPSVLNLCKSGTRLMAAQGLHCLLSLSAVCGSIGYPRTVPRYCEEILGDGKVHKNRKRGSVMALTAALRAWKDPTENGSNSSCFVKHIDQLVRATKEAATNRDPEVREEGRKLYWAMHACCDETRRAVQTMFHESSREMKNLKKEREAVDAEWEEGYSMNALSRTGVLGPKPPPKKREKSSRVPPPGRNFKRPASAGSRFRAEHGTPFKAHRVSTPMKLANGGEEDVVVNVVAASTGKKLRPPSKLSTPSTLKTGGNVSENQRGGGHDVASFSSKIPRTRLPSNNTTATERDKSEEVVAPPRSALKGRISSSHPPRKEGKENSSSSAAAATPFMTTPTKKSAVGFHPNTAATGTPVVNLLARASPLSAEKVRSTGDVLGTILSMLEDRSPHEQSLGIKALALFAKEEPRHRSWEDKFPSVLGCLLGQIKSMPTAVFEEPVDFIRSPSKKCLSSCHQMQHLFLQGVRSLLQFVPNYVKSEQVKDIVRGMLECTKDAPFEIVHTAERALQNLVAGTDPETCFEHLLPFTFVDIDLNDKSNPPALLSALRTMRYLVDKISMDTLRGALPSLLPLFHAALCHKSVDMRKATVFVLVEVHFVMGGEEGWGLMDEFTDCQRRLVDVYIERHPKNESRTNSAETAPGPDRLAVRPVVSA